MSQSSKDSSIWTPRRLLVLVASLLVALGSGTNYVYSAYAPQLGSRLRINHTKLNIVGLAGNIGVYSTAPIWGRVVDYHGPRGLLCAGFACLLAGYLGIRHFYDTGLSPSSDPATQPALSDFALYVLAFCGFLTGVGGNAGLASSLNVTAKSFPDRARGSATGIVISGFGLSAFFFSLLAHTFFPGNTSSFLLVLALGTSLPMVMGFFLVRPVPLPAEEHVIDPRLADALEDGADVSEVRVTGVDVPEVHDRAHLLGDASDDDDESSPILGPHERQVTAGSNYVIPNERESHELRLSPSREDERARIARSRSRASRKSAELEGILNIHGKALFKSFDFWLGFTIMSLLSGTGLMYINNVGSVSQALFSRGNAHYDEVAASQWQATQVSTISIGNFSGRIIMGLLADYAKNQLQLRRSACLVLVSSLFLMSQIVGLAINDVTDLWKASAALGLSYGMMFGLMPTLTIEWFGLPHFSENWGFLSLSPLIGGNLFSLAFGRNLDAHAEPEDASPAEGLMMRLVRRAGLPSDRDCLQGRACYAASLQMTVGACALALVLSIWATLRDRRKASLARATIAWAATAQAD